MKKIVIFITALTILGASIPSFTMFKRYIRPLSQVAIHVYKKHPKKAAALTVGTGLGLTYFAQSKLTQKTKKPIFNVTNPADIHILGSLYTKNVAPGTRGRIELSPNDINTEERLIASINTQESNVLANGSRTVAVASQCNNGHQLAYMTNNVKSKWNWQQESQETEEIIDRFCNICENKGGLKDTTVALITVEKPVKGIDFVNRLKRSMAEHHADMFIAGIKQKHPQVKLRSEMKDVSQENTDFVVALTTPKKMPVDISYGDATNAKRLFTGDDNYSSSYFRNLKNPY